MLPRGELTCFPIKNKALFSRKIEHFTNKIKAHIARKHCAHLSIKNTVCFPRENSILLPIKFRPWFLMRIRTCFAIKIVNTFQEKIMGSELCINTTWVWYTLFSSVYIASKNKLGKITTILRNSECLKCCTLASLKNKLTNKLWQIEASVHLV